MVFKQNVKRREGERDDDDDDERKASAMNSSFLQQEDRFLYTRGDVVLLLLLLLLVVGAMVELINHFVVSLCGKYNNKAGRSGAGRRRTSPDGRSSG